MCVVLYFSFKYPSKTCHFRANGTKKRRLLRFCIELLLYKFYVSVFLFSGSIFLCVCRYRCRNKCCSTSPLLPLLRETTNEKVKRLRDLLVSCYAIIFEYFPVGTLTNFRFSCLFVYLFDLFLFLVYNFFFLGAASHCHRFSSAIQNIFFH